MDYRRGFIHDKDTFFMKKFLQNCNRENNLLDLVIIIIMCLLLCNGAKWQFERTSSDANNYQCYAISFWHGMSALGQLKERQCDFLLYPSMPFISNERIIQTLLQWHTPNEIVQTVASQTPEKPFHILPFEYPLLTMIPFSLVLLTNPYIGYQQAFACEMLWVAVFIYFLLRYQKSRIAAIIFATFLIIGGWSTAVARFDLIPAGLTLVALLLAERKKWNSAFVFLMLAVFFKIYPIILFPLFLIAQQKQLKNPKNLHERFTPLLTTIGLSILLILISFLFSVKGTVGPLGYFQNRPFQIESFWASLLFVFQSWSNPLTITYQYGSMNLQSPVDHIIAPWSTFSFLFGLIFVYWLYYRKKCTLAVAVVCTLLITLLTGKVLSPQYLIWIAPLLAYIAESKPKLIIIPWIIISILTSWIYPYIYNSANNGMYTPQTMPLFYLVIASRNIILLLFILSLLLQCWRKPIKVKN
jgi:hypothetical protein